jgi:hypothetical protein
VKQWLALCKALHKITLTTSRHSGSSDFALLVLVPS